MKIHVDVGHDWRGQMLQCLICGCQWTVIRHKSYSVMNCVCPGCNQDGISVGAVEPPWVGTVEVEINGEYECS